MGQPSFGDERYSAFDLTPDHFFSLPKRTSDCCIAFVDGGRAELLAAPNFAVGLNRVYFCLFKGDKRIEPAKLPSRIDYYTICYATTTGNQIVYKTELVPIKEEWKDYLPNAADLEIDSFDHTLVVGNQRIAISRILDVAREFSEWLFSKIIIEKELQRGDVIVRDGTLQTFITHESKYANEAYEVAKRKGVYYTALSKTSTLFTDTGQPLFSSIQLLSESSALKDSAWYYYPIVAITHPDHEAEMFAVKLHQNSDYVFRFEILRDQITKHNLGEAEQIISSLAANSRDVGFPGYPYGLIDADRFARVSMNEKTANEFQLRAILSSDKEVWENISKFIRSSDAHEVLNKLIR